VHSPEAAGGEHADAGERGQVRRGRHRGRARLPARGEDREVANAGLGEVVVGDPADAVGIQSDLRHPVEHRDRGGRHAAIPQHRLELDRGRVVARSRQAVGDDRRLERDDGTAGAQRGGDFRGDRER